MHFDFELIPKLFDLRVFRICYCDFGGKIHYLVLGQEVQLGLGSIENLVNFNDIIGIVFLNVLPHVPVYLHSVEYVLPLGDEILVLLLVEDGPEPLLNRLHSREDSLLCVVEVWDEDGGVVEFCEAFEVVDLLSDELLHK